MISESSNILAVPDTLLSNNLESGVDVFVHPFAELYERAATYKDLSGLFCSAMRGESSIPDGIKSKGLLIDAFAGKGVSHAEYLRSVTRRIKKEDKGLVVIAEEENRVQNTINFFRKELGYNGAIYYYATQRESPRPITSRSGWTDLTRKIFLAAACGRVYVSGQYHKNLRPNNETKVFTVSDLEKFNTGHGGCVSAFAANVLHSLKQMHLDGGESVEITNAVFPEK